PPRGSMASRAGPRSRNSSAVSPSRKAALSQLRWIISRFADADDPGWAAPDDHQTVPAYFHWDFTATEAKGRAACQASGTGAISATSQMEDATSGIRRKDEQTLASAPCPG